MRWIAHSTQDIDLITSHKIPSQVDLKSFKALAAEVLGVSYWLNISIQQIRNFLLHLIHVLFELLKLKNLGFKFFTTIIDFLNQLFSFHNLFTELTFKFIMLLLESEITIFKVNDKIFEFIILDFEFLVDKLKTLTVITIRELRESIHVLSIHNSTFKIFNLKFIVIIDFLIVFNTLF